MLTDVRRAAWGGAKHDGVELLPAEVVPQGAADQGGDGAGHMACVPVAGLRGQGRWAALRG